MGFPRFLGIALLGLIGGGNVLGQTEVDSLGIPVDTTMNHRGTFFIPEFGFFNAVGSNGELVGPVRFTPLGIEVMGKLDISKGWGGYFGGGWRHVGFIRQVPDTNIIYKYRTWNLSVSGGFAIGNMNGGYLFAGMTLELPFHYRERRFENGEKVQAYSSWFSDRTPATSQALVLGFRSSQHLSLKCMYYLSPFFRPRSIRDSAGVHVAPIASFAPHIVSISIQYGLFVQDDSPRMIVYGPNY